MTTYAMLTQRSKPKMADNSVLDKVIGERLRMAKTAPDRIRELERLLEGGRLIPAQITAIHEELSRLRNLVKPKR
jgi:hypothetical protein